MYIIHGGGWLLAGLFVRILLITTITVISGSLARAVDVNDKVGSDSISLVRYNTKELYTHLYNGYLDEPKRVYLNSKYAYCSSRTDVVKLQKNSGKEVHIYAMENRGKHIVLKAICFGFSNSIKHSTQKEIANGTYARFVFAGHEKKLSVNPMHNSWITQKITECFSCFLLEKLRQNKFRGDKKRQEMVVVFNPINRNDSFIEVLIPVM